MSRGRVNFERGILRLESYARATGHANPKFNEEWLGWRIGIWVAQLRAKYRKGKLTTEQANQAMAAGVRFSPPYRKPHPRPLSAAKKRELENLNKLSRLRDFYIEHGHINVKQLVGTKNWPGAGRWITRIRTLKRQNKLPQSVIQAADKMNLNWDPGTVRKPGQK